MIEDRVGVVPKIDGGVSEEGVYLGTRVSRAR